MAAVPRENQNQQNVTKFKFGGAAIITRQPVVAVELSEAEYDPLWPWRRVGRVSVVKLADNCPGGAV